MSDLVQRKTVTVLDKIRKYYLRGPDSVVLTEKQESIRVSVDKAWNLLIHYHSREQTVKILMYDSKCSRAQAYRYITYAESVFGNPSDNNPAAEIYILKEELKVLKQEARKDGDRALVLDIIKQEIKLGNYDKIKEQKYDPEKLRAQTYIIKVDPKATKAIEQAKTGGSYDFNMLDPEDIEYKEVTPEDDEE